MTPSHRTETASLSDRPAHGEVRAGEQQDWKALETYLRSTIPGLTGPLVVRQFPKGYANLTYLLSFGSHRLVVRRPPFGQIAPGAHDMAREYKALAGLAPVFRPAPRPFAYCDDTSVIGAPFLVVEYREGVGIWDAVPSSMQHHKRVGERVGIAATHAVASLHLLDPAHCGLADLGRPQGFVERQLKGWIKRWELVASAEAPEVQRAAEVLGQWIPASNRAAILHNDFKLDNCQFDPDDPDRVSSIFDWDQATLGDPMIDLGILLNYWPDPSDDPREPAAYMPGARSIGLPPRAEIVRHYAAATGFEVDNVDWYHAFAAWKTAVVQQQLYARYRRGETSDARMAALVPSIRALGQRALRLLEGSND